VPTPFQISTDSAFTNPVTSLNLNVPATATLNNVKLFVRYNPTAAASNSGSISISSTGATTRTITIAGRALAAGTRFVSVYSPAYTLFFETIFTSPAVPSASQAFVVSGVNLGSDSLVVTAPTSFEVSLDNNTFVPVIRIPNTSGAVSPTVIFTRYNPVSQSALNQQLYVNASSTASSTTSSATNIIMFLNGNSAPLLNSSSASLQKMYTTTGKRSMPVSFTVNGKRLVDSVAITATTGFMVSIDSINYSQQVKLAKSGTTLADRKVFVVFMGNTAGATNGNISLSTTNGASIPVAVSGVGINPPAPTVNISTSVLAPFATSVPGPTAARSFTFDASDLVDSLTISVGGNFELSPDSVVYKKVWKLAADMNGKIAPFKLFCRYNRANAGNDNDTIRFNSLNLLQGKVAVSGTNYTGVASTEKDLSHMVLYPNPVANAFYLAGNNSTAADLSVELYDLSGRKLKEIAFGKQAMGAFELEVNTSDLQNGFYLVKIVSDENTTTKRILINK
jgi:hypothetical protein